MMPTSHPTLTEKERFILLVDSFPTMANRPGTMPWDALEFARWATETPITHAERQAAAFLLTVWNGGGGSLERPAWFNSDEYCVGWFDIVDAMSVWDANHAAAFQSWFTRPFWP